MRFLLDAQLPRRLISVFVSLGHEAVHTLDLPKKNKTPDEEIIRYSIEHDCIVTTKDADFVDTFYLRGIPQNLLLISTGNINNKDLETMLRVHLPTIVELFENNHFVELTRTDIIAHS